MAYTTPRTWVAGEIVTAANMNAHLRDNLNAAFPLGVDAWTSFTPTLTQSGAVTKTVTYAKYARVGRAVMGQAYLTVTGTGTGANPVKMGLPVAFAATAGVIVGPAYVFDSSANLLYTAVASLNGTNELQFLTLVNGAASQVLGSASFTAALASGDLVLASFHYEAAS